MKLNEFQRKERKALKEFFGKTLVLVECNPVTFAFIKTGPHRGKLAWSIHSESDGKFRRKAGEYVALVRLADNGMPVEFCDEEEFIGELRDSALFFVKYDAVI